VAFDDDPEEIEITFDLDDEEDAQIITPSEDGTEEALFGFRSDDDEDQAYVGFGAPDVDEPVSFEDREPDYDPDADWQPSTLDRWLAKLRGNPIPKPSSSDEIDWDTPALFGEDSMSAPSFAGVDVSPHGPKQTITGIFKRTSHSDTVKSFRRSADNDTRTAFERSLTPLAASELVNLQHELESEDTVFVRRDRARARATADHSFGFVVAWAVLALWAVHVGTHYLNETLPHADIPTYIAAKVKAYRTVTHAVLFGLGLFLPVLTTPLIAMSVSDLLIGLREFRLVTLLPRCVIGLACAAGSLFSLAAGHVVLAAVILIVWVVLSRVFSFLDRVIR
jgi:hypothetical protein